MVMSNIGDFALSIQSVLTGNIWVGTKPRRIMQSIERFATDLLNGMFPGRVGHSGRCDGMLTRLNFVSLNRPQASGDVGSSPNVELLVRRRAAVHHSKSALRA